MASLPSSDEYIDSEHEQEYSDSDSQRPSEPFGRQGRPTRQTELGPGQDDTANKGSIPQSLELVHESNAVVKSSEGESGERKPRKRQSSQKQSRQSQGFKPRSAQSRRKEMRRFLSKGYRDLLNLEINEARQRSASDPFALGFSQVGATAWSSREKDSLFQRVQRSGVGELRSLHDSVPRKSEPEVQEYLQLFQDKILDQVAPVSKIKMSDIPAAYEVSGLCDAALNHAASALELHVHEHDVTTEQTLYGEKWLIDDEAARQIELDYESTAIQAGGDENQLDSLSVPEQYEPPSAPVADFRQPEMLLMPAMFLDLSSDLFMNNGENPDLNWHHLESLSAESDSPALFYSVLQDFHRLTISVTRRLVQVAQFQAMSRLRAEDASRADWTPLAAVRQVDVHSALDILNMPRDAKDYWTKAARRCRLHVYSDSKHYNDGRQGTRQGHRLSYEEVEAELSHDAIPTTEAVEHEYAETRENDTQDVLDDSDLFTDASEHEIEAKKEHQPGGDDGAARRPSRKRKRTLSPASFCRAETAYLEALDHNFSLEEETRLKRLLPSTEFDTESAGHVELPQSPGVVPEDLTIDMGWRDRLNYEAEWEHPLRRIEPEEFHGMERAGQAGRKHRSGLVDEVHQILGNDSARKRGDEFDARVQSRQDDDKSEDESARANTRDRSSDDQRSSVDDAERVSHSDVADASMVE